VAEPGHDADGEQDARDRKKHVDDAHQEAVHLAARAAGNRPDEGAADEAEEDGDDADGEADLGAVENAAQLIVALLVRAHQVHDRGRLHAVGQLPGHVGGIRGDDRGQDRDRDEERDQDQAEHRGAVPHQPLEGIAPEPAAGARLGDRDGGACSSHQLYLIRGLRNA
jgi:hypothetical protein